MWNFENIRTKQKEANLTHSKIDAWKQIPRIKWPDTKSNEELHHRAETTKLLYKNDRDG